MKVKLDVGIVDFDGRAVMDGDGVNMTIGKALVQSTLNAGIDQGTTGEDKFKRYEFARELKGKKEVDLTIEEMAELKKRVGQMYTSIVVGRVFDHLENAADSGKTDKVKADEGKNG